MNNCYKSPRQSDLAPPGSKSMFVFSQSMLPRWAVWLSVCTVIVLSYFLLLGNRKQPDQQPALVLNLTNHAAGLFSSISRKHEKRISSVSKDTSAGNSIALNNDRIGHFVAAKRLKQPQEPQLKSKPQTVEKEISSQLDTPPLNLSEFHPKSMLKVAKTDLKSAKFPVVDVHSHFFHRLRHDPAKLKAYVDVMDRHRIAVSVSLDGTLGHAFDDHKKFLWSQYPDRFVIFANIDWRGEGKSDDMSDWAFRSETFVRNTVEQLKSAKKSGASGLKIFKQFGLKYRDASGKLLKIDDPRFDPIWAACGELEMPVIIHTADPAAFFLPINAKNERYEELSRHPDWSFHGDRFPSRKELLDARNRVIKKHGQTKFIGAHVANNAEDLRTVAAWLEEYPNLVVGIASRISELGRQPYSSKKFFLKYQDRILFGTDGPWPELRLTYYWRFLETLDESFPYSEKQPQPQGLWLIYGIGLPDNVLKKVYFENSFRVIPGLKEKYQRTTKDWKTRTEVD